MSSWQLVQLVCYWLGKLIEGSAEGCFDSEQAEKLTRCTGQISDSACARKVDRILAAAAGGRADEVEEVLQRPQAGTIQHLVLQSPGRLQPRFQLLGTHTREVRSSPSPSSNSDLLITQQDC